MVKRLVLVLIVGLVSFAPRFSEAFLVSEQVARDSQGNIRYVDYTFAFSPEEAWRLHSQWGYNIQLGTEVVTTIFAKLGVLSSVTSKVAQLPAYGAAVGVTATQLWMWSLDPNYSGGFRVTYRSDYATFGLVQEILGLLGDEIMPFGEAGNRIIGLVNDVLNGIVDVRSL